MKSMDDRKTITMSGYILSVIRPFYWQVAGSIIVALYWSIHVSLQPYVIKLILDSVNLDPTFKNIITPVIYYIILSLAFTLNFRFYDYISLRFYPKLKANIIEECTEIVSHHSYNFFQNQFSGALADRIKNLSKGTTEMVQMCLDRFFSHFLALLIACGTLMTVNIWLAIILLTWALFLVGLSMAVAKKARHLSQAYSEAGSRVSGKVVDRFTNILNVRLFASYKYESSHLKKGLSDTIKRDQRLRWFLLKLMTVQGIATSLMISGTVLVLIYSVHSKAITIGDFGLVMTLTLAFAEIIWDLAKEVSFFSEVYGMVSQGVALLNQKHDIKDAPGAKKLIVTQGEICFQKVHFKYGDAEPLFSDKSITIEAGEKVGLVGFSGSGKSTFINLILRLFDIDSGKILIDGQDIAKVTQDSLHKSIGLIPQDPSLFHRTLMENIRYGRLDASDEEVYKAARQAHAHEFIKHLPLGYEMMVGERGVRLSGGQRQRIAIARAILKNAPILLLDEATSALDSITENIIKNALLELMQDKTTLVVAHRLSTLLHMDRILVFKQGKIVEEGNHKKLLEQGGMYRKLWDAQIDGFIPDKVHPENVVERG